ncbi:hypothetical protein GWK47_023793 [Chionoecetes opilio]|uniref:Uncharacterized protein n=1 Tax=Chionoecetes opilio TaxID=41210 RepID=A0A8J4XLI4_CHIOP|nr:hypothetical protein GWK47_023793 [Chionoecetes opilio]
MSLSFKPEVPLVLHWDGKLLPSLADGRSLEERVAVLVSEEDTEELLGVPVSADGTGQVVAETVLKLVRESSLEGNIIGMALDTTAANTGMVQGACIRIERALEKPLVWLACRHHILEVVLKDVFEACMGPSSGPNIALFKRLQNRWPIVDQSRPQPLTPTALSSDEEAHRLEMLGHLKRLLDWESSMRRLQRDHPAHRGLPRRRSPYILPCSWCLPHGQMDGQGHLCHEDHALP